MIKQVKKITIDDFWREISRLGFDQSSELWKNLEKNPELVDYLFENFKLKVVALSSGRVESVISREKNFLLQKLIRSIDEDDRSEINKIRQQLKSRKK